jgi:hypothetical protein
MRALTPRYPVSHGEGRMQHNALKLGPPREQRSALWSKLGRNR